MTIRLRLTMGLIAVILVANSILSLVLVSYLQRVWMGEVQKRVRLDLNFARAVYQEQIDRTAGYLDAASRDRSFLAALEHHTQGELVALMADLHQAAPMDMLSLLDAQGRVILRGHHPSGSADDLSGDPIVAQAIATHRPASGTIVLSHARLVQEGNQLAQRADIELQPTAAAWPTDETRRLDGMAAAVAVPILDPQGKLQGLLYGGNLLNRRLEIVDAIRGRVFPADLEEDHPQGNVTIFQGDLRIATNVVRDDGTRAVGTRMSREVHEAVLERGETWSAPAFVVNDWYITAYEPIRDPSGAVIGALYVGLPKAPFAARRNVITAVVLTMAFAATLASLLLVHLVAARVLGPIKKLLAMTRQVAAGDLSARVAVRPPGEMGVLCRAIDQMADAVCEREEKLKQATRQHIGRTEKLASIGRLAAGVAHEINNPLTGVLTFACLMREKPNMDGQDREDLDLIIRETSRAAEIVKGLLDFARERPFNREPLDVNEVVRRTIKLIRNQKLFDQIVIDEQLAADLPTVDGDMNQLQQVFLNLALNACEAMPSGGAIAIRSRAENGRVTVALTDTGCGIKQEHIDQIFEPFFTTKPVGKGTGLGLSVSYGIVRKHGGTLDLESAEGRGATFTVSLPESGREPLAVE